LWYEANVSDKVLSVQTPASPAAPERTQ